MVGHNLQHPNVHRPWSQWSELETLHVATAYSNPYRWRTRRLLMDNFRRSMAVMPNVVLHVGELAYGDRPWEVTGANIEDRPEIRDPSQSVHESYHNLNEQRPTGSYPPPILFHEFDVQLRTDCEMWHKENILNRVISTFPHNWKYGAIVDGDFTFTRHDLALEAIHLLQHYDFVQLFSSYADLSAQQAPWRLQRSFAWNYQHQQEFRDILEGKSKRKLDMQYGGRMLMRKPEGAFPFGAPPGATGGAWAFRRSAFDAVGGLLDVCVLGSADWHMAFGLVQATNVATEMKRCTKPYVQAVLAWQEKAAKLQRNIGCVECHAIHHFHGSKRQRAYGERWSILQNHDYNPVTDLARDWQGIWRWNGNKPRLRDDVRRYFMDRNEDNPNLTGAESHLV